VSTALGTRDTALARDWKPFVGGRFLTGATTRDLFDPATAEKICQVQESSGEQVEEAIAAARKAFDDGPWPRTSALERAKVLFQLADLIDKHADELSRVETLNAGKPIRESRFDVSDAATCLRYYAGLITKPLGQTMDVPAQAVAQVVREPIGVCGQIIPWNYPLQMAVWKIAPALGAGNTVVLKPSECTPLTALILAELLEQLDLPPGTVNIVTGDGAVGQVIAASPLVDKIAFTGSGRTGRAVAQAALGNLKKVTLELGGKSPMIVFKDFDVDVAVDYALYAIYCHAGQVCSAGSRFLVEEAIFDEFLHKFVQRSQTINIGPGINEDTEMGPLISESHKRRVLDYVGVGQAEGARMVLGGDAPEGSKYGKGYFVNPTIFAEPHVDMRIVQEEIFGPVSTVERFAGEPDAIRLANSTRYGLAAAVFTNDSRRAYSVARAVKAGVAWINGFHSCFNECPFGGYKESGWGRECGTYGLEAYTEIKLISLNMDRKPINWISPK
jgi:betaine-aldehyde dehydrogenase